MSSSEGLGGDDDDNDDDDDGDGDGGRGALSRGENTLGSGAGTAAAFRAAVTAASNCASINARTIFAKVRKARNIPSTRRKEVNAIPRPVKTWVTRERKEDLGMGIIQNAKIKM